jgi:hypothetical protein
MATENMAQEHTTVEKEEAIMKNWRRAAQVIPMDHIIAPKMNLVTY